jgi:hypothetical protein
MWPKPSYVLLYVGCSILPWLYIILLHFWHSQRNWSSSSLSSTTFQNFRGICALLFWIVQVTASYISKSIIIGLITVTAFPFSALKI